MDEVGHASPHNGASNVPFKLDKGDNAVQFSLYLPQPGPRTAQRSAATRNRSGGFGTFGRQCGGMNVASVGSRQVRENDCPFNLLGGMTRLSCQPEKSRGKEA